MASWSMTRLAYGVVALLILWGCVTKLSFAQETGGQLAENAVSETVADSVIAKLGAQEIRWSELLYRWREVGYLPKDRASVDPVKLFDTVNVIREQRIADAELTRRHRDIGKAELETWIKKKLQSIEGEQLDVEDLAAADGLALEDWKRDLHWRLTWQRYVAAEVTDEELRKHFDKYPSRFDGTRLEVFHILISCQATDIDCRRSAKEKLQAVRQEIVSDRLTFAAACEQYSSGATAKQEGRLGWLVYEGPMHPKFIEAAFQLKANELSPVIETPYGVHLIRIGEVEKGDVPFERSIESVRRSLLKELFAEIVAYYPNPPELVWMQ